ncbi:tape measure protein [Lysinibacillus sp. LZ02]|uniref:tape measure protein n=1 Tax=Lysinibacillus sp. LZ02 TaxID=3420668 RepID=UPI003D36C195
MATIRTAIQIQDNLSQAFGAMNVAMQATINSFEHLERASGNAIDASSIEIARRELARAESAFNEIEIQIREADHQQDRFNDSIREGTSAANAMLSKLLAIVGAYLSIQTIVGVVGLSDEMINTTARLELMNDGLQTTAELQRMIYESAQRTFAPYQATADMVGKLGTQAAAAFNNSQEIIAFAEQLNKTFAIAGTSAQGIESVMLQLTQAMASGRLQGEELNAILDNAQPIVANIQRYLEDVFNMDASNIKKLAADGVITAEIIKNSMFYAAQETNAAFESMPDTWSGVWTIMTDKAVKAFEPILQKINDVANSERMESLLNNITNSMYMIAAVTNEVFDIMIDTGAFVYDNWSIIGPIVGGVTAALVANSIAWLWANRAIAINILMTATASIRNLWYVATTVASTFATYGFTAAMAALSIAISANPIGLFIAAIIVLITLFYLAVGAINHFAGTSISATGIIAGAFMVLASYIYNRFALIWNIIASFFEFFVNVGTNTTYSVKRLFYNLASAFLDYAISMTSGWDNFATGFVNAIITAVNGAIKAWNWFVDLLPDDISAKIGIKKASEFSHRESITTDLENIKGKLGDWVGEAPADYWEAPRMEMKSLGAAWDKGYNWGANLFGGDPREEKTEETNPWDEILAGLGDIANTGSPADNETAGNTAKMAKSMEGTVDELKYLRDLAERESINRYTTAEVKLEMKNENHIHHDTDVDGLIDRFGEKAEELVYTLAERGDDDDV